MSVQRFADSAALIEAATAELSAHISEAIDKRGRASLMLSGGSSPKPIYEALGQHDLPWDGVGMSLVDERWVPAGADGSNADFIRNCFAGSKAERALFVPLYNGHDNADAGVEAAEQALAILAQPFDVCVMGMGLDGHTASWFPNSGGLDAALDPENAATLCTVDATGCPVAGDHTDRITLTYSAVAKSRHVILLLTSEEKFAVYQDAADASVQDAPVKVLKNLGAKLSVFALESAS